MDAETDARFTQAVQPGPDRLFGAVVIAASNRDGSKRYTRAYGTRTLTDSATIATDSVFWIASCTKLLTGIATLQCVERGLFSLDSSADVARLIPEYAEPDIVYFTDEEKGEVATMKAKRTFTARELLTLSSGFGYDFMSPEINAWRKQVKQSGEWDKWSAFEKMYRAPLLYSPGESWLYGTSFEWAQTLVERSTGLSLGAYFSKHIFAPLGMDSSAFFINKTPGLEERNIPPVTRLSDDGLVDGAPTVLARGTKFAVESGGGGLFSTAEDYMAVLMSLLRNDEKLLAQATVREMMRPALAPVAAAAQQRAFGNETVARMMHAGMSKGMQWRYGLGGDVLLSEEPGKMNKGMFSWGGMPNCIWFIQPEDGYCGVMLTQLFPVGDAETDEIRSFWYQQLYKQFAKQPAQSKI